MVTTPEPTAMTDAYATIKVLAGTQAARPMRLLVKQVQRVGDGLAVCKQLQAMVDRFVNRAPALPLQLALLGEVPMDAAVRESIQRRALLLEALPGSPAAIALVAAAGKLLPP